MRVVNKVCWTQLYCGWEVPQLRRFPVTYIHIYIANYILNCFEFARLPALFAFLPARSAALCFGRLPACLLARLLAASLRTHRSS